MNKIKVFRRTLFILTFITLLCVYNWTNTKILVRDIIYLTRPVWDRSKFNRWQTIAHYYINGLNASYLCELHNWKRRINKVRVIDAIIFSVELDLLEIRLKEMWNYTDYFIVLEADKTFTGRRKRLVLNESLNRFSWAKHKLIYQSYNQLKELKAGENPFQNENSMRNYMNSIIKKIARNGDIIICSDVDEIPSTETVQLLKECDGYPSVMHLQLKMYLYSFEFMYSNDDSWRPHIASYDQYFEYRHGRVSDYLLADSGWHCSFCFRYISDFIFKMTSYSHSDRVMRQKLLDYSEIQRKICNGDDIYDMYPEVYSFKEMFLKLGSVPKSKSMTNLPKHLVLNPIKFSFLLPDGCVREDFNRTTKASIFL